MFTEYQMKRTHKTGTRYRAANGGAIENMGEGKLDMSLSTGEQRGFVFQVADKVTKPLGAVSRIIEKNHQVVFDKKGSYIRHKPSGAITWLKHENGVFVMEAYVNQARKSGF